MAKSFFYRLFGIGKISVDYMSELQTEGVILLDEGVKSSVTYLNFHRSGKSAAWERRWFTANIALTKTRLLALNGNNPVINVPLTDERIRQMHCLQEDAETLCIAFDAGLFQPQWSGTVEYRFHTPEAQRFQELMPK